MVNYSISEFSEKLKISKYTLRYYERMNLLIPKRKENGYRFYDDNDFEKAKYIMVLKSMQIPLNEILELISIEAKDDFEECRLDISSFINQQREKAYKKIKHMEIVVNWLNEADKRIDSQDKSFKRKYINEIYNFIINNLDLNE